MRASRSPAGAAAAAAGWPGAGFGAGVSGGADLLQPPASTAATTAPIQSSIRLKAITKKSRKLNAESRKGTSPKSEILKLHFARRTRRAHGKEETQRAKRRQDATERGVKPRITRISWMGQKTIR